MPSLPPDKLAVMGRVAAPHAVHGWVKIQPFTEYLDSLLDYETLYLGRQGAWRPSRLLDAKVHGHYLLARLEGVNDRDAAEALQGVEVAVNRDEFPAPDEDEYYWDDLIGLAVVNAEGAALGKVAGLLETGANDVLRVVGERDRLIPFVAAYVREVDLTAGRIVVDWGLDY